MPAEPIRPPGVDEPRKAADLPSWYPAWARDMADLYFSGTTCLFVLHGNVHDLIRSSVGEEEAYTSLSEFLATQVFGSWDIVLHHDLARGLRPLAGSQPARLKSMVGHLAGRLGEPGTWPREPEKLLLLLDRFIEHCLLEDNPARRKRVALLFHYAQYLVPAGDIDSLARGLGTNLVRFLGWAQNPYIQRVNIAFVLVADHLSELNDRLVQSPHVAAIEVPMPGREERERFIQWIGRGGAEDPPAAADFSTLAELAPAELAEISNGLSLVSLNVLLSQARRTGRKLDHRRFREMKKTLIERQCRGLLEFVEPSHTLDLVVGQEAAKTRLREDAELLLRGRLELAPMGYLLCGPVGTGKTFLAECYAGSVGIPCVKLRNFRSKYVGETEGNLEQVLAVLRSLGPVVVIIDEADAALGNREAGGDSGTSSRVFSMIASQMGDTRYRGKIVWMLLTCRPDLIPIDLKRQGRAEVHIPMFYPAGEAEVGKMFLAMARKNKLSLAPDAVPRVEGDRRLSGADIESVLLAAKRGAIAAGSTEVRRVDIESALGEFIPSAQGLEKELQELAAVLECTQLSFLPPDLRAKVAQPDGRARLQERLVAIRQLMEG
ncbi:MAG TPA: AAA family ATPase [Planctomycetota bacterium]|nr:AAA family ATPase [Planctomycetota bacterium]